MSIISQRFGKTNSAVLWRKGHHFCISLYVVSAGGGNVMDGAGKPNSLKNPSKPAGVSCTSIRTCSESIVNECTTSHGAKTIVPGVALISGVLLAYEGDVARMPFLGVRDGEWELVVDGALVALYEFTLQHLEQKGCRSVDLGESQTFLNDGVLRSKRKYGHILSSASIHKFLIRVLSDTSATRAFLQNNPFIFQHAGELRGAVFLDAAVPPSRQILDEIHKEHFHPGLSELLAFFFSPADTAAPNHPTPFLDPARDTSNPRPDQPFCQDLTSADYAPVINGLGPISIASEIAIRPHERS